MVWKYNAVDHVTQRHNGLLNGTGLDPQFIIEIQVGKEEEVKMGVPNDFIVDYRAQNPGLFPEGADLAAIEAKAQGDPVSKKRRRRR